MKKQFYFLFLGALIFCSCSNKSSVNEVKLTKAQLMDKVKGGWAGQLIGCSYGGPTEFKYKGVMIDDSIAIE